MKGLSSFRQDEILNILRRDGQVRIGHLSEKFGVTSMTVWRDLKSLEKKEALVCVHGGAVLPENRPEELLYSKRKIVNADLKNAIGLRASELVHSGLSIFLDGSTTAVAFAKNIKQIPNLVVFTDSLSVFFELQKTPSLQVILLGGELQLDENTLSGPLTLNNLRDMVFDYCFFSAAGFALEGAYNKLPTAFETKKLAITRSKTVVLLADSTKYDNLGSWQLCHWNQINTLVSDDSLSEDIAKKIETQGTKVIRVSTKKRTSR
jgi:DeoR family transcriptional regulator of aga operon